MKIDLVESDDTSESGYLKGAAGALHAHVTTSDVALESSLSDSDSMTIAAATVTAQIFQISPTWNQCELDVGAITGADTLTITISRDNGTNYRAIDPIDQSDGAQYGAAGVISAAGAYRYPIKGVTHLAFTKTGANGTLAIAWKAVI